MTTVDRVPRWSTLFSPLQETAYQLTPSVHFDCVTSWTLLKAPLKNKKQPIPTGCQYPKSRNPKPDLVDARRIPQNCQNPVPVLWKVIVLWTRPCLHFLVEDPFLLTLTYSKFIWFISLAPFPGKQNLGSKIHPFIIFFFFRNKYQFDSISFWNNMLQDFHLKKIDFWFKMIFINDSTVPSNYVLPQCYLI